MPEEIKQPDHPSYWDMKIERTYGDVLEKAVLQCYPTTDETELQVEKDLFYYCLALLRALDNLNATAPEPTEMISEYFESKPISKTEFTTLHDIFNSIQYLEPDSAEYISDDLLQKCEKVIENFEEYEDTLRMLDVNGKTVS